MKKRLHKQLLLLFARLHTYGMVLNSHKYILFITSGIFLSFKIRKQGIKIDQAKVSALRNRPIHTITTKIHGFVNIASYFKLLIDKYSKCTGLLTNYYTNPKNAKNTLLAEAIKQYKNIRDVLISSHLFGLLTSTSQ